MIMSSSGLISMTLWRSSNWCPLNYSNFAAGVWSQKNKPGCQTRLEFVDNWFIVRLPMVEFTGVDWLLSFWHGYQACCQLPTSLVLNFQNLITYLDDLIIIYIGYQSLNTITNKKRRQYNQVPTRQILVRGSYCLRSYQSNQFFDTMAIITLYTRVGAWYLCNTAI
jgi:hypothetical protein